MTQSQKNPWTCIALTVSVKLYTVYSLFFISTKLMDKQLIYFLFFCCYRDENIFLTLLFPLLHLSFFSFMLSDWVWRLSNKLHKDCGFARVVSWGSRVHFMHHGFSGNKQVSGVHVCIVFLQLGCNFDPVILLCGRQSYSQPGEMTSLFLVQGSVCVCVWL